MTLSADLVVIEFLPGLPEPVTALAVLEVSEHTISLSWSYQSSGSQQRTGVEVIVERSELLERMTVGADDTFATFSSLLPLTNYTVTLYVLSEVGRSLSTAIQASTLSLSQLLHY